MAKKYYWLQLKSTFFSSRIAKKLLKAERGKIYALIYLKMLLFSVDKEGRLFFEGVEHTFAEEIALVLDEEPEDVKATIETLESAGAMKQIASDEWYLTEMPEMIGGECDSAERVRKHRAKTLQCNADVTECNKVVTDSNTEKSREEKNIEENIRENKSIGEREIDYGQIVRMYNETCVSLPQALKLTDERRKAIKARLNKYTLEDFKRLFEIAEGSEFLKGGNKKNWMANFDWLINDSNMAKTLEGRYDKWEKPKLPGGQDLDDFYAMTQRWAESEDT